MRRRLKCGTECLLSIAAGDTAPNQGPEEPFEMRKAKRVRFVDTEMDGVPVHASWGGHEATQSPRSGAPKTSEYAYFRKVKDGALHGHSRSLHKENEQLMSSKVNYLTRETSSAADMVKPSVKNLRSSVSGERVGPSDHHLFLSPHFNKHDEQDHIRSKELTDKVKKRSSLLSENATPVGQSPPSSPLKEAVENSENQCLEKGIFSAKTHRLRQWVAHTSFPEVEKHPKWFDSVSSPMSRLFPKGNEKNDSSKGDTDNGGKSLTFHQSSNLEKGLHLSHKRDKDKNDPKICTGKSSEIVLTEWDTFVSGFPSPNYGTENHVEDELMNLDLHSKSHIRRSSHAQHDYSFCLPLERYRAFGSFHFKGLDEFGSITEHAREAPNRLLLECDSGWGKDEVDSSIINHGTAKNVSPRLATSWNVDEQQIVDNVVDARGFWSSSLFSNYYLEFHSLPNYGSSGCLMQDFGPNFDDVKCAVAEPGHFSLALPCTPNCSTVAEDRSAENIYYDCNIFSYKDQYWLKNQVWDGEYQCDFWWKCLSAADFSAEDPPSTFDAWPFPRNKTSLWSFPRVEEDPGDPCTPFSEGTFNNHLFSSTFQSSFDTFISHPFLLNHVGQDRSKQEYFDDDDDYDDNKLE